MKKNNPIYFIDLFCGAGGLSAGMELAGLECILGVEEDRDACMTFMANHPHSQVYRGKIEDVDNYFLKGVINGRKIDAIVGGPPCQGFSVAGRGFVEDPRNRLFMEFLRIVKIVKPTAIIVENVTGLVAKKNRAILDQIFKEFGKLGYKMDARILSSEQFGVPEKRRRTIIMGIKRPHEIVYPKPSHGPGLKRDIASVVEAFQSLIGRTLVNHDLDNTEVTCKKDRARLKHIPAGKGIRYQADEEAYLPKRLRLGVNWDEIEEGRFRQTKLQRLPLDSPSPTIMTSKTLYYHPTDERYLTVREVATIQSFPIDFEFFGSATSQFKQVGNAVPPLLGKALGNALKLALKSERKEKRTRNKRPGFKNAFCYQDQHCN